MIICCGEALIDMVPRHIEGEGDAFLPIVGGGTFNTAIALGRLGEKTGFVSGISTDLFGEQLIEALRKSNVQTDYCVRSDHPTTLAFVRLTDGNAYYSFFDENSAGRSLDVSRLPTPPESAKALHFCGISLIPEPCGNAFETLMNMHADKRVISLDPSIRENFITDPPSHRQRIKRMIGKSDIVKVSDEDLAWIAAGGDGIALINEWLKNETKLVVLTQGESGGITYTSHGTLNFAAHSVTVVDTIGAGDTFNAGLLFGLNEVGALSKSALSRLNTQDLEHALALATHVAGFTVTQAGANPPWREQLKISA
ncbi:MAG: carbohydrate kinase [Roseovarius sp.]|nr:carbohydrate kinase [Roseovarius sp.]